MPPAPTINPTTHKASAEGASWATADALPDSRSCFFQISVRASACVCKRDDRPPILGSMNMATAASTMTPTTRLTRNQRDSRERAPPGTAWTGDSAEKLSVRTSVVIFIEHRNDGKTLIRRGADSTSISLGCLYYTPWAGGRREEHPCLRREAVVGGYPFADDSAGRRRHRQNECQAARGRVR